MLLIILEISDQVYRYLEKILLKRGILRTSPNPNCNSNSNTKPNPNQQQPTLTLNLTLILNSNPRRKFRCFSSIQGCGNFRVLVFSIKK